jgi:hypothetical protein
MFIVYVLPVLVFYGAVKVQSSALFAKLIWHSWLPWLNGLIAISAMWL